MPMTPSPRAGELHRAAQAREHRRGQVMQQFLVLVQQRFALGGVDDEGGNLGVELDGGGEAAAAGADDPEFVDTVERTVDAMYGLTESEDSR